MVIPYNTNLTEISKHLRRKPTEAERSLWRRLKLKHLGFVFHRQKPIGGYIADFYCPEARLVIEVDGDYHAKAEAAGNDKTRDEIMHSLGITVLRVTNDEIFSDIDVVVKSITKVLLDSVSRKEDKLRVRKRKPQKQ